MRTNRHKKIKMNIDRLLEANAKYQAANVCVTNTPESRKRLTILRREVYQAYRT